MVELKARSAWLQSSWELRQQYILMLSGSGCSKVLWPTIFNFTTDLIFLPCGRRSSHSICLPASPAPTSLFIQRKLCKCAPSPETLFLPNNSQVCPLPSVPTVHTTCPSAHQIPPRLLRELPAHLLASALSYTYQMHLLKPPCYESLGQPHQWQGPIRARGLVWCLGSRVDEECHPISKRRIFTHCSHPQRAPWGDSGWRKAGDWP